MEKNLLSPIMAVLLFLCAMLLQVAPLEAASPTPADVSYAKQFISAYSDLELAQQSVQKQIIAAGKTLNSAKSLEPFFVTNLASVKKFYMTVYNLKPTPVFQACHNAILRTAYNHLTFLNKTISLCQQNVDLPTFQAHVANRAPITKEYSQHIVAFLQIVKSWPDEYYQQVKAASKVEL